MQQLNDISDLSRLCRTSKVLNYMALPQLYEEITLTRDLFSNEKLITTSSFLTALNTLTSGNVGPLVKNLVLQDDTRQYNIWRHWDPECVLDYPALRKLPVGAAVERCTNLQSYTWDLFTVIKPSVYRALGQLQHLQSLRICYWVHDVEHGHFEALEVPPLPRLRELTVEGYLQDYRHDFSAVLLHATRLEVLNWQFNQLWELPTRGAYTIKLFDQLRKARRKLRLKSFRLHNGGCRWSGNALREAIDVQQLTELSFIERGIVAQLDKHDQTMLESTGGPWLMLIGPKLCLKSIQYNRMDWGYAHCLGSITGLERMYMFDSSDYMEPSLLAMGNRPSTEEQKLRDTFLDAIVTNHGATLRHLMLPHFWPLTTFWIAKLFRTCPNITQLSLATECKPLEAVNILVPFLRKLWAIRVYFPGSVEPYKNMDLAEHFDFPELRYIALEEGVSFNDQIWEFGGIYEKDGMWKRTMKKIWREDVKDVEIWKMAREDEDS
jgi:hypothetical protein